MLPAVLLAIAGGIVLVVLLALVLWRWAQLLQQRTSVARVEFLRLSRSYGVGRGQ